MKSTSALLTVLLLVPLLALPAAAVPAMSKPNILIILADDSGFSDLGCYGSEIATPNLDHLAQNGLRFTQFYNCGRCAPSRAAILTGFYGQQVRRDRLYEQQKEQGERPEWAAMLPEMLKPLGYHSYHSGKWHLPGTPLECGFEHSFHIERAMNNYFDASGTSDDEKRLPDRKDFYATTGAADYAIRYLREHARKYPAQPFFTYLAFTSPHFPLQALPEDIARYRERFLKGWDQIRADRWARMTELKLGVGTLPSIEQDLEASPRTWKQLGSSEVYNPVKWPNLTPDQQRFQATKMAIHAAMTDRMDREIGRVLEQIRAMGAWKNTLILFASDNGASREIIVRGGGHDPNATPGSAGSFLCLGPGFASAANTPFRRHKIWVHEGGISTPLIAHWPAGIAAKGELRNTPGHLIDIVPTVLEVAGGKPPTVWNGKSAPPPPGRSLVPVFARDAGELHQELWFCHQENRALRMGDWKIVAVKRGPWELYHLAIDRGEMNDLAAKEPERLRAMASRWEELSAQFGRDAGFVPPSSVKPKASR